MHIMGNKTLLMVAKTNLNNFQILSPFVAQGFVARQGEYHQYQEKIS
jgi:hypothetical protein